jgi:hypothetical protein
VILPAKPHTVNAKFFWKSDKHTLFHPNFAAIQRRGVHANQRLDWLHERHGSLSECGDERSRTAFVARSQNHCVHGDSIQFEYFVTSDTHAVKKVEIRAREAQFLCKFCF